MKQSGMTLIELMIVVAIVGILSAIAYPAYESYVQSSRRSVGQGGLLEIAQVMERAFTTNGVYPTVSSALPFVRIPATGNRIDYNVTLTASSTTTEFFLRATPVNGQATDTCGALTLNSVGNKGASFNVSRDCWQY